MKGCKRKFIFALGLVVVLTLSFGLYYRWSQIQEVSAVNVIRKVIPAGPVFWMAHEGDYVAGVGTAENNHDETALYLYDTKGTLTDLSDDTYTIIDQVESSISHITFQDNYITWLDNTGWSSCSAKTLKAYNITTSTTTIISDQVSDYIYGRDGNKVVYQCKVPNGRNIAMYDLSTQQTTIICDAPGFQRDPFINNNIIVWEDSRNPQTGVDIYLYNLSTQTETLVAEDVNEVSSLHYVTNGEYVFFIDFNDGDYDRVLYKYHIATSSTSVIATSSPDHDIIFSHSVNNNFVVWKKNDLISNNSILYLHDLATSQNIQVDTTSGAYWSLRINEDHLVYIEMPSKIVNGFDLNSMQLYPIRTVGETRTIYLHPTENTLLMCSKGAGMNPIEWDISYALIP